MRAWLIVCSTLVALHAEPGLKEAAALYHRGHYDSALAVLDASRPILHKRRDSLSLFQYSGMASARLGQADQAAAHFRVLLGLDSLFQFPRNEEAVILQAFANAKASRNAKNGPAQAAVAVPVSSPSADPGVDSTTPIRVASAGEDAATPLPVGAHPSAADLVPIPAYADPRLLNPAPYTLRGDPSHGPRPTGIGLAMGAIPLGGGWLAQGQYKQGLALAFLQIGGAALSLYASSRVTAEEKDLYGIQDDRELGNVHKWQWTQEVALFTALGSYLYSLIASRRP